MTTTQTSDILVPEILNDAVQGQFKGKNALMDSVLVSSGALVVAGTMPLSGPGVIGQTVRIPYFGTIGDFEDVAEGSSATPVKIQQGSEDATVAHAALAFETTTWARNAGVISGMPNDPHQECARQIVISAKRKMDKLSVAKAGTSPLLVSHYNATSPTYLSFSVIADAKARKLGDEQADGVVALVTHSLGYADLVNEKDSSGRLMHTTTLSGALTSIDGIPVLQSDSVLLNGSTMGTVAPGGSSPPGITLAGTPTGAWDLRIKITLAGAVATAKFQFSTDGGNLWSEDILTSGTAIALTDTAKDSLVGNNGKTGLTIAFTAGTHALDNTYASTANLCVETQIWMPGAAAFWFNQQALALKSDTDILKDSDVAAMHLYACPHLYRRRNGGSRPGVVRIKHNVRGYTG